MSPMIWRVQEMLPQNGWPVMWLAVVVAATGWGCDREETGV